MGSELLMRNRIVNYYAKEMRHFIFGHNHLFNRPDADQVFRWNEGSG